jgi:hypothetical protein
MSNKAAILLAVMLLTCALLGSSMLTRGHWWGDDFAAYIMQAKSILAGDMDAFVTANTFTVTQSSHQIGPAAYPWGYPLMLAPVYALIGLSPPALKLPGLLTYLGFLFVFFCLTRRRFTLTECERMPKGDYLALSKKVGENLQIPPERIGECNLPLDKVYENRRFVVYRLMD